MSLKDRNARVENNRNRLAPVLKETLVDINVLRGMVPAESVRGAVPKDRGVDANELRGMVAVAWPSAADDPTPPSSCSAITKKGAPCKAKPVKGERLCIGHSRATVGN